MNILKINPAVMYCDYLRQLGLNDSNDFEGFINSIKEQHYYRMTSGKVQYPTLLDIANLLSNFEVVEFDDHYGCEMIIDNWSKLMNGYSQECTLNDYIKWVYRGSITDIVELIDEDIRYSESNSFLLNLRDSLCMFHISENT